ncbi:DUF5916 domain-containing protein [Algoriphagus sp.]|uniref:carbohydrate binding family 9 domain-containing protein n=1 Tax=Algoriphagus sp. TaxID=1872435 RepID=UPI0039197618
MKSNLLFLVCSLFSIQLLAQEKPRIEAYFLDGQDQVKLDGSPDEAFWQNAKPISQFLQQEPIEGQPASERTEIRIAYDRKNLYISAIFYDSEPDQIKAFQRRRDANLSTDDSFTILIDSYNDQRSGFYFEINPLGMMGDAILKTGQGSTLNTAWNGIWRAWVKRRSDGWSAEIQIPFMTLNFDPSLEEWGINFQRIIRRKNEIVLWSGHQRNQGIRRPQDAGVLSGLKNISQGIGVEAIPYVIANQNKSRNEEDGSYSNSYSANAGGEINYNITPNLKAGITVNTDFAETEVDNRQINLTRFPLFFPERRDFFLQGANIFLFAPSSNPNPYFSRRVGLQRGRPIPIKYGGRLIGRIKNTDVGVLHVNTAAVDEVPEENFTVARVIQNLGAESTIGGIYTRRNTQGDSIGHRESYGIDMSLSTSKFLRNKNLQLEAFVVGHSPNSLREQSSQWDRSSRGFRLNFPNQPWDGHVSYREFGADYNPAVGFAPRIGFRRLQPSITYSPLIEKSSLIRELSWQYYFEYLMGMDWKPATVNNRVRFLGVRLESGDSFRLTGLINYEFLDRPFDILRDGQFVIQTGEYTNQGYSIEAATASFRRVGGSVEYTNIGFWTGRQENLVVEAFLRPFVGLNVSAGWDYSNVNLLEGSFQTHLFRLITAYDFSPWVSLNFNIQYDNITEFVGTNTRFVWVISPGNTFYVVYNHNWVNSMERLVTTESGTAVKLTYTFRF